MNNWNRKQVKQQKERLLGKTSKEKMDQKIDVNTYPTGYYPGKSVSFEEAQQIERYDLQKMRTGDARRHWVNAWGEPVAFSY